MVTLEPRPHSWLARNWPRCLVGLDPVATFGPEVLDVATHPADLQWALVVDGAEAGIAWANRYENRAMWTYGLALFPEHRRSRVIGSSRWADALKADLFADPNVTSLITMAYSSNPSALRLNGLRPDGDGWVWAGPPSRRVVGHIVDAAGPGVDLYIFQTTRSAWEAEQHGQRTAA